jgi:hypothetical protein
VIANLAVWDSQTSAWAPLSPLGDPNNAVRSLAIDGAVTVLYACGQFSQVGGQPAPGVGAWDGSAWSSIGDGTSGWELWSLIMFQGALHAGGEFETENDVGRWNGGSWVALTSSGLPGYLRDLETFDGVLVAAGTFGTQFWDGVRWLSMHPTIVDKLLGVGSDHLFAITSYRNADTVLEWRETSWQAIGEDGMQIMYELSWYCNPDAGYRGYPCDQCHAGFFGERCVSCADCTARRGTCYDGATGNCTCPLGWAGDLCDTCAANFFGVNCTDCAVCGLHGVCYDGIEGNCTCLPGWTDSPSCATCFKGHYGAECDDCAICEAHGTCHDGLAGNCTCDLGWAGASCSACSTGWTGADCTNCAAGYFRREEHCVPCAQCEFGTCGAELCQCYEAWAGLNCSECARGFYGASCFDCDVCAVHGFCVEGRAGECICDSGWTGPKCQDEAVSTPENGTHDARGQRLAR